MLAHITKFGLVGILNTVVDFVLFNILTNKKIGLKKIHANLISTTVAMAVSFSLNRGFVFGATKGNLGIQLAEFLVITAFGLYVLQNLVIHLLLDVWTWPVDIVWEIAKFVHLDRRMSEDFVRKNSAKLAATVVSLTWNYILFSLIVFK